MSDQPPRDGSLSDEDVAALRWLAIAWGVMISTAWLVLDGTQTRLLFTAFSIGVIAVTLLAIRWLRRRRK